MLSLKKEADIQMESFPVLRKELYRLDSGDVFEENVQESSFIDNR